jgi:hypothetical protein
MTPLKILSKDEENIINQIPKFSYQEKEYFFKLPNSILLPIDQESNKALFILMFGYFKATNRFFTIDLDDENLYYVKEYYHFSKIDYISNSPRTIQRYKRLVKSDLIKNTGV